MDKLVSFVVVSSRCIFVTVCSLRKFDCWVIVQLRTMHHGSSTWHINIFLSALFTRSQHWRNAVSQGVRLLSQYFIRNCSCAQKITLVLVYLNWKFIMTNLNVYFVISWFILIFLLLSEYILQQWWCLSIVYYWQKIIYAYLFTFHAITVYLMELYGNPWLLFSW